MDRDYLLLGVRKNASREQIQKAYERQLLKYKSADYEDEPEYVRRRINELNAAYNRMYSKAGASSSLLKGERTEEKSVRTVQKKNVSRNEKLIAEKHNRKSVHHQKRRDYEKKRREMDGEELHLFDRLRKSNSTTGNDGEGTLKKADLFSLKDKAKSLKERMVESIKEGNSMGLQEETSASEEAAALNRTVPDKSEDNQAKMYLSAIGVIISLVVGLFTMCESTDNVSFDDVEDDYSYVYELSDYSESDRAVYDEGQQLYSDSFELEFADEWSETTISDTELEMAANAFVKAYTADSSMASLCDRLYQNYGPFAASGSDDVSYQTEEVLRFYGFPDYYEMEGRINPYNQDVITNMGMYLRYLVQYHEISSAVQKEKQSI